jgi:hypothetical protein
MFLCVNLQSTSLFYLFSGLLIVQLENFFGFFRMCSLNNHAGKKLGWEELHVLCEQISHTRSCPSKQNLVHLAAVHSNCHRVLSQRAPGLLRWSAASSPSFLNMRATCCSSQPEALQRYGSPRASWTAFAPLSWRQRTRAKRHATPGPHGA